MSVNFALTTEECVDNQITNQPFQQPWWTQHSTVTIFTSLFNIYNLFISISNKLTETEIITLTSEQY